MSSEVLGLLDTLEATLVGSKKVPLTEKVMVDERAMLAIIDKIRFCLNNHKINISRRAIDAAKNAVPLSPNTNAPQVATSFSGLARETMVKAEQEAKSLKAGAEEYADYVMANLQLMIAKLQTNMVRLEKNIEDSRRLLEKTQKEPATKDLAEK